MGVHLGEGKDENVYEVTGTRADNKVARHSEDIDKGRELTLNCIVNK
jgi:hypothetical protein